jgi:hypothetical protein
MRLIGLQLIRADKSYAQLVAGGRSKGLARVFNSPPANSHRTVKVRIKTTQFSWFTVFSGDNSKNNEYAKEER